MGIGQALDEDTAAGRDERASLDCRRRSLSDGKMNTAARHPDTAAVWQPIALEGSRTAGRGGQGNGQFLDGRLPSAVVRQAFA
jgi:hypothetical protein